MVDTWCVMIVCLLKFSINPFTAKWSQRKFSSKFANFILWSFEKQIAVKVQAESFHLNGHIVGFHPQTQKLESPYKTPSSTLAVKGLKSKHSFINSPISSLLISTLCHSISWLYRQVLSLLTRPYSLKAADQEFAFQTSLFQAGITIFSNLWTFISFYFFIFLLFLFVFIPLLL